MTLVEKLNLLQELLANLKEDTASAFTIQGLYREPEDFTIREIPDLIRLIKTEDFQFRFNFKDMDSVGRIRARKTGEAVGGLFINPRPAEFIVLDTFDFKTGYTISRPQGKSCGWHVGGLVTEGSLADPTIYTFNFKGLESMAQQLDFIPVEIEANE